MCYRGFLRPLLFLKDPEKTHEQTIALLSSVSFLESALEKWFAVRDERLQVRLGSLTFFNPVGLAAGFDKNAKAIKSWPGFGFGFMEIGAVTARAQPGNLKPRLFRLPEDQALINRLGFNNEGADAIAARLAAAQKKGRLKIPLGINIGRTKVVETKDAAADYLFTFERLYPFGDYFTLNVSSPNTPNLRELQEKGLLGELLDAIQTRNRELAKRLGVEEKPVLVKIAPDMEFSQLDDIIEASQSRKIAGIIATNATAFLRENLVSGVDEPGGLSGKPLRAKATSFIRHLYKTTQGRLPIIGSGGIFTAEDAYEKIKAGATAVQIYTGFVYEGPSAVKRINLGLLRLIEQEGFKNISEAVGKEVGA
jgi:dihydroorotate dehydrogenase